ncbi:MAG: DUF1385 domain-containing protein [Intestinibacter sp.]|uniref:DUF1385 domain-containing protein n=1 Tax=Intestinibacter sp. TaxID=1965304 RepID=UPI0025BCBAB2|nr:DUF1385 domain-containing protein [Intestinibacter sp.]MCI6737272.1 DUF1385 domain-containing protein [Intestinibacter sp.]
MENKKRLGKVGGQAVIEGVMMQSEDYKAIAVRKPNGEIEIKKDKIKSWVRDKKIDKIPFLRGGFILIDTMVSGIKSLNFSSEFFLEEEEEDAIDRFLKKIFKEKANDAIIVVSLIISLLLSVGIFVLIPTFIGGLFAKIIDSHIALNLIEGAIRIAILIAYMAIVSLNSDIKRVFEYHGAEHKTVYCYENDLELTVENARKFGRLHPRCGTNFLFIVMFISIILFSFFGWPNPFLRVAIRILCIPIVAGISYEIIKFLGKYNNILSKIVAYPGMMMQKITTKEPDDGQLEVAIAALKAALGEN